MQPIDFVIADVLNDPSKQLFANLVNGQSFRVISSGYSLDHNTGLFDLEIGHTVSEQQIESLIVKTI